MDALAGLFVNKPWNVLAVGGAFAFAWLVLRATPWGASHRPGALLLPSVAWAIYAAWEWAVTRWSPEADIRVDLLVLWPLVGLVSLWGLVRVFRAAA